MGFREILELLLADQILVLESRCWVLTQHQGLLNETHWMEAAMLILTRREGEEIIVNERMRIRVLKTSGGRCKLAFDAPESDRIRRAELPPLEEEVIQRTAAAIGLPR